MKRGGGELTTPMGIAKPAIFGLGVAITLQREWEWEWECEVYMELTIDRKALAEDLRLKLGPTAKSLVSDSRSLVVDLAATWLTREVGP